MLVKAFLITKWRPHSLPPRTKGTFHFHVTQPLTAYNNKKQSVLQHSFLLAIVSNVYWSFQVVRN